MQTFGTHSSSKPAAFIFVVALLSEQSLAQESPREYYRKQILQEKIQKQQEITKQATSFWPKVYEELRLRQQQVPNRPSAADGWALSVTTDRLSGTRLFKSERTFVEGSNSLRVEFVCHERTKQLDVSFYDASYGTRSLNIPFNERYIADLQMVLIPPPLDESDGKVYGHKWYFDGKRMTITGFNRNSWGVSICGGDHGGAGYVYNAIFCTISKSPVSFTGFKDWDWIRYSWLDFAEVRFSIRTVWIDAQSRQSMPAAYFSSVKLHSQGLYETLNACDRDENPCLQETNGERARACHRQFEAAIQ